MSKEPIEGSSEARRQPNRRSDKKASRAIKDCGRPGWDVFRVRASSAGCDYLLQTTNLQWKIRNICNRFVQVGLDDPALELRRERLARS
ncbi:MAG: hypothetical protein M0029_08780 [Actinomycetota bacterium]|nr:hypothetical protein [Actinomycetota bacterium]